MRRHYRPGWLVAAVRAKGMAAASGSLVAGLTLQLVVAISGIMAARLLGVTDRGRLALLWVITLVVGQLGTMGVHAAMSYAIAAGESPQIVCGRLRRVIGLQLVLTPLIAAPIMYFSLSGRNTKSLIAAGTMLVVPPMFVLLLHGLSLAQGGKRYRIVQLHRLVQPSLYVLALAVLAVTGQGRFFTVTIAYSVTMLIGGSFAWRQGLGSWWPPHILPHQSATAGNGQADGDPDLQSSAGMVRFGRRSLFSAFGVSEHLAIDQLVVGLLLPAAQFGLYTAGMAFANLPRYLGQSIGYVAYPEVVGAPTRERRRAIIRRFVLLSILVVTPIAAVLISLTGWLTPLLLGSSFQGAIPVAQLLIAAGLLQAVRRVATECLRGIGDGQTGTAAELVFAAVLFGSMVPLVNEYGARGAAAATVIGAIVAIPAMWLVRKNHLRLSRAAAAKPAQPSTRDVSGPDRAAGEPSSSIPVVVLGAGAPDIELSSEP